MVSHNPNHAKDTQRDVCDEFHLECKEFRHMGRICFAQVVATCEISSGLFRIPSAPVPQWSCPDSCWLPHTTVDRLQSAASKQAMRKIPSSLERHREESVVQRVNTSQQQPFHTLLRKNTYNIDTCVIVSAIIEPSSSFRRKIQYIRHIQSQEHLQGHE
mmetsp:Transcript_32983/g.75981  ORF Transcript_32983/g.75981 Transcript_32983/m.75981 type:complete len:159 (+) Transcript_32983:90-566(+)